MLEQFSRTELLLGGAAMKKLAASRVIVFGVGGVGSYAVEALARSGVGAIDLVDGDRVSVSNINRQLIATLSTVGEYKADVAARRIADINPECRVTAHKTFFLPETADELNFSSFDYAIDAIDTVAGKLEIAVRARAAGVPVISAMGAGNKLDATAFEVADVFETSVCPLAKVMRRELKRRGVDRLKVVYSKEPPIARNSGVCADFSGGARRSVPASVAFVPSVAGLIIAGEVIKDLINAGAATS